MHIQPITIGSLYLVIQLHCLRTCLQKKQRLLIKGFSIARFPAPYHIRWSIDKYFSRGGDIIRECVTRHIHQCRVHRDLDPGHSGKRCSHHRERLHVTDCLCHAGGEPAIRGWVAWIPHIPPLRIGASPQHLCLPTRVQTANDRICHARSVAAIDRLVFREDHGNLRSGGRNEGGGGKRQQGFNGKQRGRGRA